MTGVYLLYHQFEFRDPRLEDLEDRAKLIGVYSDRTAAEQAIERVKNLPGFRDYPDGFVIDEYVLNEDNWSEGFVTVYGSSDRSSQIG